jgi:hypothetical protein
MSIDSEGYLFLGERAGLGRDDTAERRISRCWPTEA